MGIHTCLHRDYLFMSAYVCVCLHTKCRIKHWTTHCSVDRFATAVLLEPLPFSLLHKPFDRRCMPAPLHSCSPPNLRRGKKFPPLKTPTLKCASVPTCEWAPEAPTIGKGDQSVQPITPKVIHLSLKFLTANSSLAFTDNWLDLRWLWWDLGKLVCNKTLCVLILNRLPAVKLASAARKLARAVMLIVKRHKNLETSALRNFLPSSPFPTFLWIPAVSSSPPHQDLP